MSRYYFSRTVHAAPVEAEARVVAKLADEGFGILTEIDVSATLKKKLGEDYRPYRILGACNPPLAHRALTTEDKIGTMLPCNVIIQQVADGQTEVAAVDPMASMQAVENPHLTAVAKEVRTRLRRAIEQF